MTAKAWRQDADPLINAAMGVAVGPVVSLLGSLDTSSEKGISRAEAEAVHQVREYIEEWMGSGVPE